MEPSAQWKSRVPCSKIKNFKMVTWRRSINRGQGPSRLPGHKHGKPTLPAGGTQGPCHHCCLPSSLPAANEAESRQLEPNALEICYQVSCVDIRMSGRLVTHSLPVRTWKCRWGPGAWGQSLAEREAWAHSSASLLPLPRGISHLVLCVFLMF